MKAFLNKLRAPAVWSSLSIIALLLLIAFDARVHFDADLIQLKRQHKSAQKNWNLFYDQRYVYADSAFRYEADFESISQLIEPNTVIFSDISTSYYSASYLPVYVKNIHRHHGRLDWSGVSDLLSGRKACYLQDPENVSFLAQYFRDHNALMREQNLPEFRYILVNKDVKNLNLRLDCLWTARERLMRFVGGLSALKYEGQYLNLYQIN